MTANRTDEFPHGAAVTLEQLENDPHPVLARLREREPVSWLPALDGWLVTRYDLAVRVMRDAETFTVDDPRFSTAQVVGPSMLSLDGEAHARHHEPFITPFRPRAVRERFRGSHGGASWASIRKKPPAATAHAPSTPSGRTTQITLPTVAESDIVAGYDSTTEREAAERDRRRRSYEIRP